MKSIDAKWIFPLGLSTPCSTREKLSVWRARARISKSWDPGKSPLFAESEGGTRFRNIDLDNIDFKAVLRVAGVGGMWGWEEKLETVLDTTFLFFFSPKNNFYLVWRWKWSHLVMYDSLWPHGLQSTRLIGPWDSPGKNTGMGCHFLLQRIFPTEGSNLGIPHCKQILYLLSHQGSPSIPQFTKVVCVCLSNFKIMSLEKRLKD